MTHLLDTNVCVALLRPPGHPGVIRQLLAHSAGDIVLSTVVEPELLYGAYKTGDVPKNLAQTRAFISRFASIPFDSRAAERYGEIRRLTEITRKGLGPYDLMIAATALVHGLVLVTHNVREFGRVPSIVIEDWQVTP